MATAPSLSIYDLARRTKLSASTISRVLNNTGRISTQTRERVLAAVREAGFKPRVAARDTRVAVVVDRVRYAHQGSFVSQMLAHLVQAFARHAIAAEIYTEDNAARLGERFVDGVVALSWDDTTVEALRRLNNVPIVLLNRMDIPEFSCVATDHRQAGRLAGDYLVKRGHERIGFLAEERDWGAQERLAGLIDAMRSAKISLPPESLAAFTQHQPLAGALKELLRQKATALFIAGEDIALEATWQLTEALGVNVPGEMSIVGVENQRISAFTCPPQSTVRQPLDILARTALDCVLEQIASGQVSPKHILIPNEMVERASVSTLTRKRGAS